MMVQKNHVFGSPMSEILYEDNHIIVAVKPSGQLTDNDDSQDLSLLEELRSYVKIKYQKPGQVYLTPVHRIDRGVSGIVLFARTSKSAERLNAQFRDRKIEKIYLAFVVGNPPDKSRLEDFLVRDRRDRVTRVCDEKTPDSKGCVLDFVKRVTSGKGSLLEVRPITGRPHQIRVQLSSRGWPIVGDVKYSSKVSLDGKILLHAHKLTFLHPTLLKVMTFEAPLPDHWQGWA